MRIKTSWVALAVVVLSVGLLLVASREGFLFSGSAPRVVIGSAEPTAPSSAIPTPSSTPPAPRSCCAVGHAGTAALEQRPAPASPAPTAAAGSLAPAPPVPHLQVRLYGAAGSTFSRSTSAPRPDRSCALRAARATASTDRGRAIGTHTACAGCSRAPCIPDSRTPGRDCRSPTTKPPSVLPAGSRDVDG